MQFTNLIVENIVIGGMGSVWIGIILYKFLPKFTELIQGQLVIQKDYLPIIIAVFIPLILIPFLYALGSLMNDLTSGRLFKVFNYWDEKIRSQSFEKYDKNFTINIFNKLDDSKRHQEKYHFMRFYLYHNSSNIKNHLDYHRSLIRVHRSATVNWLLITVAAFPWWLNPLANYPFLRFSVPIMALILAGASFCVWSQQTRRFYEMIIRAYIALKVDSEISL